MEDMRIYVALSGGVDSSVALGLLKEQGHDVCGVFIEVWQPDFLPCTQDEDRKSALRVAAHFGVPFYTLDAREAYKRDVVDMMVRAYERGETPNPDVWCNRSVKFGALRAWIDARGGGMIATGHYAQMRHAVSNFELLRGVDMAKDQTYFLWQLTQQDLSETLFPIGHLPKPQVRALAKKFGLPTATRKDSQGLCFMGKVDMKEFLTHFIPQKKGIVLNEQGEVVGEHDGALFYTLGQRHGFSLSTKNTERTEMYVVAKNVLENTLTIGHAIPKPHTALRLMNVNQIVPWAKKTYRAQIRYHGSLHTVSVDETGHVEGLAEIPASGQSVVLYDGDVCVGGGIVE